MMHRHLLTLFALFTGLAALQAPAQAAAPQTLVAGAETLIRSAEAADRDRASMAATDFAHNLRQAPSAKAAPAPTRAALFSAPVLLRVDRALE